MTPRAFDKSLIFLERIREVCLLIVNFIFHDFVLNHIVPSKRYMRENLNNNSLHILFKKIHKKLLLLILQFCSQRLSTFKPEFSFKGNKRKLLYHKRRGLFGCVSNCNVNIFALPLDTIYHFFKDVD